MIMVPNFLAFLDYNVKSIRNSNRTFLNKGKYLKNYLFTHLLFSIMDVIIFFKLSELFSVRVEVNPFGRNFKIHIIIHLTCFVVNCTIKKSSSKFLRKFVIFLTSKKLTNLTNLTEKNRKY